MNIIQGMHLSRMRIVLLAVVLAIAGLLVSASQIGAAGAATAHAAGGGGPKPTVVLEHRPERCAGDTVRYGAQAGQEDGRDCGGGSRSRPTVSFLWA